MTGNVAERRCGHLGCSGLIGMASDGLGQWMLRFAFYRGGERQQLIFIKTVGDHVGDLRFSLGQGSSLVNHDGVDVCRGLQRGRVFEQHAPFGAESGADHDCGWCG